MLGDNRPVLSKSWELLRTEVFMDSLEMPAESTLEPSWRASPTQACLLLLSSWALVNASSTGWGVRGWGEWEVGGGGVGRKKGFLWSLTHFPGLLSTAFHDSPSPSTGPATAVLGFYGTGVVRITDSVYPF